MSLHLIQQFLHKTTGLTIDSIGGESMERAIKVRMKALKCEYTSEYFTLIQNSEKERQQLIDDVTVTETWFFRDHEPFNMLSSYVSKDWREKGGQTFRVLSVPCSTGEEPYSIAMALLNAGLDENEIMVDAVDISTKVLARAKRGVYGKNSFRGKDLLFRDKYFHEKGDEHEIADAIKQHVCFHHQNILSPGFMREHGPYDAIFCRNLLIYFDVEAKNSVIDNLSQLMNPDGLLFLGHAETGRMGQQDCYVPVKHPGAFAYQKVVDISVVGESFGMLKQESQSVKPELTLVPPKLKNPGRKTIPPAQKPQQAKKQKQVAHKSRPEPAAATSKHTQEQLTLAEIQSMADRGELAMAAQECDKFIAASPEAAEGHCLRGVLHLALDEDDDAICAFRRALYLDPNNYESLIHISVLAEEQGDLQAAENYRNRSLRVNKMNMGS